jgi:hypothetical protein
VAKRRELKSLGDSVIREKIDKYSDAVFKKMNRISNGQREIDEKRERAISYAKENDQELLKILKKFISSGASSLTETEYAYIEKTDLPKDIELKDLKNKSLSIPGGVLPLIFSLFLIKGGEYILVPAFLMIVVMGVRGGYLDKKRQMEEDAENNEDEV